MRYLVALLLLVSAPVYAGGIPDLGDEKPVVQKLVAVARRDITRFKLNDTAFIPAETPAELSQEIIPFEDEQRVVTRANITALAEWCELDWKNASFLPFMDKERASHRWSEKTDRLHRRAAWHYARLHGAGLCRSQRLPERSA